MRRIALVVVALAGLCSAANAGNVSNTIAANIKPQPLGVAVTAVTADCSWTAGTVVATLAPTGGNGNPVTYTLTAGGPDFAIPAGTNTIVVGAGGIPLADCGKTINVSYTATQ